MWEIAGEFERLGVKSCESHFSEISPLLSRWLARHEAYRRAKTVESDERRLRLGEIARCARKLREMLGVDDYVFKKLKERAYLQDRGRRVSINPETQNPDKQWRAFTETLKLVEYEAEEHASDLEHFSKPVGGDTSSPLRKSPERHFLWEPLFRLWVGAGGKLRFSEYGPIVRILSSVHSAASLPPPNIHSVRQAVRDFNKGGVQPS
jgi:hypothetical protein